MIHRICGPMSHRPLHGTTDVYVSIVGRRYEIRMGWTFPGGIAAFGLHPFDPDNMQNYIRVVGYYRLKVAWSLFQKELKSIAESYWV